MTQNAGITECLKRGAEATVFFDQDSKIGPELIGDLSACFSNDQVNITAPVSFDCVHGFGYPIVDVATDGARRKYLPESLDKPLDVSVAISSGTMVRARVFAEAGMFDEGLQHGGVVLGLGGVANHAHYRQSKDMHGYFGRAMLHQSFSAVTAACLVVRRDVYDAVNGLDEDFAVAFNDVDFCLRVREQGLRNVWTPYAEMVHHESVSRGTEDNPEKLARFHSEVHRMQARWGKELTSDPAYNPNLTLLHDDFSLAWPPRVAILNDYGLVTKRI